MVENGARLAQNRGHIDFGDDDVRLPCPLCNNWCMLCLESVPTFVQVTHPYRGNLIRGHAADD